MEQTPRPNQLLRVHRRLRGWSQEDVAAGLHRLAISNGDPELGVDAAMVSRWERGKRQPRPRYVRLLSTLFELPVEQLGLVGEPDLQPAVVKQDEELRRRDFLKSVASLLGGAGLPPGLLSDDSEPWERLSRTLNRKAPGDAEAIQHLERITVALESLEPTMVGSEALIGPIAGHLDVISLLLQGSLTSELRSRLCSIAAESAGLAGWLHRNIGDERASTAYFRTSLEAAKEAGDRALGIALVGSRACQSPSCERPLVRIEQLQGTLDFTPADSTPSNRVWMAAKEAEAYAIMGRDDECRRTLDLAETLLQRVRQEGEERRPRFMVVDRTWLAGEQGASLAKLGRTDDARGLLLPVLKSLGPSSERDWVWLTLALATTYEKDGEFDEAAKLAHATLMRASRINLAPVLGLLRDLRDGLKVVHRSAAIQELDEALRVHQRED
jgi:transcriptional regulator with XRE-family HTH domain